MMFLFAQEIVGLVSVEGEQIPYVTAVETQGEMNGVERWLLKCEETMRKSLASITKDALEVRMCACLVRMKRVLKINFP